MAGLRQVWTLIAHQLHRRVRSIGIWGVALGGLGALYVALYPSMSSLLEPLIMAILGVLVGGLVIAMYLPIFKLGSVV